MEKMRIPYPIIVEGKYDKISLSSLLVAQIITTDGFGLYNQKEKAALLRKLADRSKIIVLTDSDGGGKQLRSYLSGMLPKDKVIHLYVPQIPGKERRKKTAGKAGILGVEGMPREVLERLFAPFAGGEEKEVGGVSKQDLYADGLSGRPHSEQRRDLLAAALELPSGMSANALLGAINLLYTKEEYREKLQAVLLQEKGEVNAPL